MSEAKPHKITAPYALIGQPEKLRPMSASYRPFVGRIARAFLAEPDNQVNESEAHQILKRMPEWLLRPYPFQRRASSHSHSIPAMRYFVRVPFEHPLFWLIRFGVHVKRSIASRLSLAKTYPPIQTPQWSWCRRKAQYPQSGILSFA